MGGYDVEDREVCHDEESSLNILSVHGAAAGHSEGHRLAGDTERVSSNPPLSTSLGLTLSMRVTVSTCAFQKARG